MKKEIFIDTGVWLALADSDDGLHIRAKQVYPFVLKEWRYIVTTNLVVAEAYALIHRRLGHKAGLSFLKSLQVSSRLLKIYSNKALEKSAEKILSQYTDQDFTYVDAVSFAVMNQRSITTAFAFDHHFAVAGFTLASSLV